MSVMYQHLKISIKDEIGFPNSTFLACCDSIIQCCAAVVVFIFVVFIFVVGVVVFIVVGVVVVVFVVGVVGVVTVVVIIVENKNCNWKTNHLCAQKCMGRVHHGQLQI